LINVLNTVTSCQETDLATILLGTFTYTTSVLTYVFRVNLC